MLTDPDNGQLSLPERVALHHYVRKFKPTVVFEVGTWRGGGSTFQIVTALQERKYGHLHTCESNKEHYLVARTAYDRSTFGRGRGLKPLKGYVTFYNLRSDEMIEKLIGEGIIPEFVFFDGPDDPEVAYTDLKKLEPIMRAGSIFAMHDWFNQKAALVKPYLENNPSWSIKEVLGPPASVGMVFAIKS